MPTKTNFSFDERVVDRYKQQRAHPDSVSQAIGQAIAAQVDPTAPLLEVGIGTGRIAWAVAAAGQPVVGMDLSPHMLRKLLEDTPDASTAPVRIAQADMHHLPYPNNTFGGALAVHVLHLATDWQRVLHEIARVLQPDGVFIDGSDWVDPQSVIGKMRHEFRMHAVRLDPDLMPPAAGVSREDVLAELGGTERTEVVAAEWTTHISPAERLEQIEQRVDSESWILTDEQFELMMTHIRQFAADTWDDIDAPQPVQRRFLLHLTRGKWTTP